MEYNIVGTVAGTHGVKGEIKIKSETDFADIRFAKDASIFYYEGKDLKTLKVRSHRSMNGYELVAFDGLDTVDDVMFLTKKVLYVEKDHKILSNKKHFYSDYLGLTAYQFGKPSGKVADIVNLPQGDYLLIMNNDNKERLVPLRDEFIDRVDDALKIVYIVDMEGLLD